MIVRTIKLFHDINMGMGHKALSEILAKEAIKLDQLESGSIVMFINKKMDKLKILGAHGLVVGYLKMPDGQRINLSAIQYIPQTFGANGAINYTSALRKALTQRLGTEPNGAVLKTARRASRQTNAMNA